MTDIDLDSAAAADEIQRDAGACDALATTFRWRDHLKVHPAADQFPLMSETDPKALQELAADIKENGLRNPIVLVSTPLRDENGKRTDFYTHALLDGRNRLDALQMLGWLEPVERPKKPLHRGRPTTVMLAPIRLIYDDDPDVISFDRDALFAFEDDHGDNFLYSLSASLNLHRRHLTADQKRDLIAKLLKADPSKSDRQIAEQTKSSPTTVGKVRAEKEASGDVSTMDTRTDTKGRKQPSSKQPSKRKSDSPELAALRERAARHGLRISKRGAEYVTIDADGQQKGGFTGPDALDFIGWDIDCMEGKRTFQLYTACGKRIEGANNSAAWLANNPGKTMEDFERALPPAPSPEARAAKVELPASNVLTKDVLRAAIAPVLALPDFDEEFIIEVSDAIDAQGWHDPAEFQDFFTAVKKLVHIRDSIHFGRGGRASNASEAA